MRRADPGAVGLSRSFGRSLISRHPNLVNLYELFTVEDRWFFTMELVEGCNFLSYVKGPTDSLAHQGRAHGNLRPALSSTSRTPAWQTPRFHFRRAAAA